MKKYNYTIKCITCGKTFLSNRSTAKYCCQFCKNQQARIQKGEKIRFTDDGFVIVKPKQYEKRKPIDKFAIPASAESYSFRYTHRHNSNTAYDIECSNCLVKFDQKIINDILTNEDKGYYIYKRDGTYNHYRLVKRIEEKAIEEDWIKNKPEYIKHQRYKVYLIVYEWKKKKYAKEKRSEKYYDEEAKIIEL